ncbi:hypothetical protein ASG98_04590 [Bacillus sp. Soil531]|nr:hypothetical protein ASG98_04590 [Bacillus sp. Soil531]
MGNSRWNKQELEVMNNYYVNGVWEEIVEMLPRKTEKQILNKAKQLEMNKESELLAHYCKCEDGMEVRIHRSYHWGMGVTKSTITNPTEKTTELSDNYTKKKIGDHIIIGKSEDHIRSLLTIFESMAMEYVNRKLKEEREHKVNGEN